MDPFCSAGFTLKLSLHVALHAVDVALVPLSSRGVPEGGGFFVLGHIAVMTTVDVVDHLTEPVHVTAVREHVGVPFAVDHHVDVGPLNGVVVDAQLERLFALVLAVEADNRVPDVEEGFGDLDVGHEVEVGRRYFAHSIEQRVCRTVEDFFSGNSTCTKDNN